jgi:2-dehydro-3-deoxyphosphogluconate aldolase / (4S)-4-hydroxy-2-oxoglutarate aldolase
MNRETIRNCIEQIGIVPAIRVHSPEDALFAVEAVSDSGIPIAEVTMTVPGAIEVISELARTRPDLIVGAGTINDLDTARRCLDAGAKFLTSTGLDIQVVEFAVEHDVVVFPGALTPTEVMAAWKAGSDFVKVFPCALLGGASYIKASRHRSRICD